MGNSAVLFLLLAITTCSKTKVVNPLLTNIPTEKEFLQRFGATITHSPNATKAVKALHTPREACSSQQCPPVERPVCARLIDRPGNRSLYVVMVNKCEMSYIKCHKGLEGVVVPMKSCDHNLVKTKGKKRSKRDAKEYLPKQLNAAEMVKTIGVPLSDDDGVNGVNGIDGQVDQREYIDQGQYSGDQGDYGGDQGQHTEGQIEYGGGQGQNTGDQGENVDQGQNIGDQVEYSSDQGKNTGDQVEYGSSQGQNTGDEGEYVDQGQSSGNQGENVDHGQYVNQDQSTGEQGQYVDEGQYVDQDQITGVEGYYQEDEDVAYQSDQDLHWTADYNYKQVLEAHLPMATFTDAIYDEDVDRQQYNGDCPVVCPLRDVMVCARCQHGVYRTFLSVCHLRMFKCLHKEETLSLISRQPCMLSAPFLSDEASEPQGRLREPLDDDRVLRYLRCKQLSQGSREADPRCYWLVEQFKKDDVKSQMTKLQDGY